MFFPKFYKEINLELIKKDAKKEGFSLSEIVDPPNFKYPEHMHPETKYLVFLKGGMNVVVNGKNYKCKPGDKLIIPGLTKHSGVVGSDGCNFFWSEKIIK